MWKRLTHPNIAPLLGFTLAPSQLISEWMSGGDLQNYIEKNPEANRLGLVGISCCVYSALTSVTSYWVSPRASATSTPAMCLMRTSRGYVTILTLVSPPY